MGKPNWENRTLFHGDNLDFLRAMNSESVDLIYLDPPFNKNRDFHATPDSLAEGAKFQDRWSWERDVHQEWADQIKDDNPELSKAIELVRVSHSDGMGAFMCFMAVRLLAMKRILKPTGSIYLHCDPTASHYLKVVMDAVFGARQFRNEIVWCYARMSAGGGQKRLSSAHDIILWYSKGKNWTFNVDPIRLPYAKGSKNREGYKLNKLGSGYSKEGKTVLNPLGKFPEDWIAHIPYLRGKERTGYPTQKPLALLERIIKASSNEGDMVLDPFAGCATTCVAAEYLNRQWVGIDIWDRAHEVVVHRLRDATRMFGKVLYAKNLPGRTDDQEMVKETAPPYLRVKVRVQEPKGAKWSRAEMYKHLLEQQGPKCQGCDRIFDDPRYLELDHNTPRSDGGINHISNRILLCSPCNRAKSNKRTLSGLRDHNKKNGWMAK